MSSPDDGPGTLLVRRAIRATPDRLFAAWTQPAQLKAWWGPPGVECIDALVDLRPGGIYRIANQFPDGRVVWITGEFEVVEPARRLRYSWRIEGSDGLPERVTVHFEARGDGLTEVVVVHEHIATAELRRGHAAGWTGCLDGLREYMERRAPHRESE